MDINQLKSFVEVAHQGNLTQAAETLHLSQPAVSAQIKAIERNLDIILFKRNAQGMTLTPVGEALLPKAEEVLQQMHNLDAYAKSLAKNYIGETRIGIIDPVHSYMVSEFCELFLQKNPEIMLHLIYKVSGEILTEVRKKEMAGGFFIGEVPYRNIYSVLLDEVRYVVIAPEKWADEIDIANNDTLNQHPWLDMPPYSAGSKIIRHFWKEHKILPKSVLTNDKIMANVALCAQGIGMTIVPSYFAEEAIRNGAKIVVFPEFCSIQKLSFIYPSEFEKNPLTQSLLEIVHQVWEISN